jgi:peroxiredoxin family protein
MSTAPSEPAPLADASASEQLTIIFFSGDLDKAMAAFIIANGALSMDMKVTMFFPFWGLNVLRNAAARPVRKDFLSRMFGWMMPRGASKLKLSKMNMGGLGTAMMKYVMRRKNVYPLSQLLETARQNGVRLIACSMSMEVMGLVKEELIEGVEVSGVGTFLGEATQSRTTLFI